jgi:tRNA-Thr(GGU) m(6)t(6)A37 methyltransferase TsaA
MLKYFLNPLKLEEIPMSHEQKIVLNPIGYVKTAAVGDEVKDKALISQIVVHDELTDGLSGISSYSHLFVLFYLNQITNDQRRTLRVHPRGRMDLPLTGVFAVRTMLRPNPIGLTVVELVSVESNVLTVKGLDAFDGTPVLDVKPYDQWDIAENVKVPSWWLKLAGKTEKL